MNKSESIDGELTASVTPAEPMTPPAQPNEKKLSMKATATQITASVKELLLLDPP